VYPHPIMMSSDSVPMLQNKDDTAQTSFWFHYFFISQFFIG